MSLDLDQLTRIFAPYSLVQPDCELTMPGVSRWLWSRGEAGGWRYSDGSDRNAYARRLLFHRSRFAAERRERGAAS